MALGSVLHLLGCVASTENQDGQSGNDEFSEIQHLKCSEWDQRHRLPVGLVSPVGSSDGSLSCSPHWADWFLQQSRCCRTSPPTPTPPLPHPRSHKSMKRQNQGECGEADNGREHCCVWSVGDHQKTEIREGVGGSDWLAAVLFPFCHPRGEVHDVLKQRL